jgi:cyclopropane fatty-acyl-phospholipid synthase-like methyltransferase
VIDSDLYTKYADDFSSTRQAPWNGWNEIVGSLPTNAKILDLGCGNGRFLKFFISRKIRFLEYVGIDNSQDMLDIAQSNSKTYMGNIKFITVDLNKRNWGQIENDNYNVIVAFGIFHHLKSEFARMNFFRKIDKIITNDGIAIVTFWMFLREARLKNKIVENLGNSDYILSFGKKGAKRFVHFTGEEEIEKYISKTNLQINRQFYSDGSNNRLNFYVLFTKKQI